MKITSSVTDALNIICRGTAEIIRVDELTRKLASGKKLKIKVGFDPTAPDLHLGHTVLLHKMRQFQLLGHEVMFLIGDFTGMIGDPTGKNEMRPTLSQEQVLLNALTYEQQVYKVLDPELTQVVFNSAWCAKLTAQDIIKLASTQTVARILERDDFSKRYAQHQAIALHELFYPVLQGYDSVHLNSDVELGGIDQKFNLLVGRNLQQHFGQERQVVIMLPLLPGLDGVKKMSKSLGNYIGINEPADEIFGKIMSISDNTMWEYFTLLSFKSTAAIAALKSAVDQGLNPRDVKLQLAEELTARFSTQSIAAQVKDKFLARFQRRLIPDDLSVQYINKDNNQGINICRLLRESGLVASSSEAVRLLAQGAIKINGNKVLDRELFICDTTEIVLQVGKKRIIKIIIN